MMVDMIFKPAARYPADPRAVFVLVASVFSALTALLLEVAPGSLENVLPRWAVIVWGVLLGLGSMLTILGMARQTLNGIITEQIGSVMVGVGATYYSVIILMKSPEAIQSIGIILAWGVACFIRWGQLQALIMSSRRAGDLLAAERDAKTEILKQAGVDQ